VTTPSPAQSTEPAEQGHSAETPDAGAQTGTGAQDTKAQAATEAHAAGTPDRAATDRAAKRRAKRQRSHAEQTEIASRKWPSLTRRIFFALLSVSVVVCCIIGLFSIIIYQHEMQRDDHERLRNECAALCSILDYGEQNGSDPVSILSDIDLIDERITLIASDGSVLYDSQVEDVSTMENHADRPEVQEALSTGIGDADRMSATVGYNSSYQAQRTSDGNVLRLSLDREGIGTVLASNLPVFICLLVVLALACWLISVVLERQLMKPVLNIEPTAEGRTQRTYRELAPLVKRLDEQQETLVRQMDTLRNANAMRLQFTANVTHELKTPLTSISGAAELIRDGIARPEHVPDFAGRIYDEAAHLTDLVNDILTLSRLDESERAGDHAIVGPVELVDLMAVARGVVDRLGDAAQRAQVTLTCFGSTQVVTGQARLLDELIYNLCDNAIRYNKPGGWVTVEIGSHIPLETGDMIMRPSTANVSEEAIDAETGNARSDLTIPHDAAAAGAGNAGGVGSAGLDRGARRPAKSGIPGNGIIPDSNRKVPFVRVSDNGRGIPKESQRKVFERFYRMEKSRSREGGGTGLGLAIVKHAAAFHDATIIMNSEPDKGTSITVNFPKQA
jgi:two-component system phosphate regulon sensor histidine kinase PhoR